MIDDRHVGGQRSNGLRCRSRHVVESETVDLAYAFDEVDGIARACEIAGRWRPAAIVHAAKAVLARVLAAAGELFDAIGASQSLRMPRCVIPAPSFAAEIAANLLGRGGWFLYSQNSISTLPLNS